MLQGVTLHALMDSCHSGTVMNLPYNAELKRGRFVDWSNEYGTKSWKRVRCMGGEAEKCARLCVLF